MGWFRPAFCRCGNARAVPKRTSSPLRPAWMRAPGHPAIWHKLLSYYITRRRHQGLERIYADVPDQPLPVNTFAGVGFQPYCRQTIWRLFAVDALADEEPDGA